MFVFKYSKDKYILKSPILTLTLKNFTLLGEADSMYLTILS